MCVVHYSQDAHLHSTYAPVPMYHAYAKYRAPPKRGKGSDILPEGHQTIFYTTHPKLINISTSFRVSAVSHQTLVLCLGFCNSITSGARLGFATR